MLSIIISAASPDNKQTMTMFQNETQLKIREHYCKTIVKVVEDIYGIKSLNFILTKFVPSQHNFFLFLLNMELNMD